MGKRKERLDPRRCENIPEQVYENATDPNPEPDDRERTCIECHKAGDHPHRRALIRGNGRREQQLHEWLGDIRAEPPPEASTDRTDDPRSEQRVTDAAMLHPILLVFIGE